MIVYVFVHLYMYKLWYYNSVRIVATYLLGVTVHATFGYFFYVATADHLCTEVYLQCHVHVYISVHVLHTYMYMYIPIVVK